MTNTKLNLEDSGNRGVVYYNIDNKDNLYNEYNVPNRSLSRSVGIEAFASPSPEGLPSCQEGTESLTVMSEDEAVTPLCEDQVRGWIAQLFDNGETAFQRYKFKIRLNLTDNTNPEFIASLTKDMRNFKKHLPEQNKEEILKYINHKRKEIKQETDHYPYVGKFHLNQGANHRRQKTCNLVEPDTFVIVWYDNENRGWNARFLIQDFTQEIALFSEYLTAKQKMLGVKAQEQWQNPKYDNRVRPLTWAEKRAKK
jgi:hypothetical protein